MKRGCRTFLAVLLIAVLTVPFAAQGAQGESAQDGLIEVDGTQWQDNQLRLYEHWHQKEEGDDGFYACTDWSVSGVDTGDPTQFREGYYEFSPNGQFTGFLLIDMDQDDSITLTYPNVGTYAPDRSRPKETIDLGVRATYTDFKNANVEKRGAGLEGTNRGFFVSEEAFSDGCSFWGIEYYRVTYEFFEMESDKKTVDLSSPVDIAKPESNENMKGSYITFESMNNNEWAWSDAGYGLVVEGTYMFENIREINGTSQTVYEGDQRSGSGVGSKFSVSCECSGTSATYYQGYDYDITTGVDSSAGYVWTCPSAASLLPSTPKDPEKTVNGKGEADATLGDSVVYEISQEIHDSASNLGLPYHSLSFTDALPAEVDYVSAEMCAPDGSDITSSAGTLSYDADAHTVTYDFKEDYLTDEMAYEGETYSLKIYCAVNEKAMEVDEFDNIATVDFDDYPTMESNRARVDVQRAKLSVKKSADQEVYSVGDIVTYTIRLSNESSDTAAKNVVLSDTLPDELSLVSAKAQLDGEEYTTDISDNSFTVTFPQLDPGSSVEVTVTATAQKESVGAGITNIVRATADNADEAEDEETVSVRKPELSVKKTADSETWCAGGTGTYTIEVGQTAEGAVARDVVVKDTLPDGLTLTDASAVHSSGNDLNPETTDNSIYLTADELAYGDTITITVSVALDSAMEDTTLKNTAVATAGNADEAEGSVDVNVARPVLAITKEADDSSWKVGGEGTYTIVVTQTTMGAEALNVSVSDKIPDGTHLNEVTAFASNGRECSVTEDGDSFTVECESLAYGEEITVTAKVGIDASAQEKTLTNTAYAEADNAGEVCDSASKGIGIPVLDIEKTADADEYYPGEDITYTIRVTETEREYAAENVVVSDPLPEGMKLTGIDAHVGETAYKAATSGDSFTVEVPELAFGDTLNVTVTATASESLAGKSVTNTASVTADNADEMADEAVVDILKRDQTEAAPPEDYDGKTPEEIVKTGDSGMPYVLGGVGAAAVAGAVWAARRKFKGIR